MAVLLILLVLFLVYTAGFHLGAKWQREHPGELPGKRKDKPAGRAPPPAPRLSGAAWTPKPPSPPPPGSGAAWNTKAVSTDRPAWPRATAPASGFDDELRFVYEDAQGEQSIRTVIDWYVDGRYFHGFCQDAADIRTFRRDRVLEWLDGTESLLKRRQQRGKKR